MPGAPRSGELRIVMGGVKDDVQLSHDPVVNGGRGSIGVTKWGIGETLTRVSWPAPTEYSASTRTPTMSTSSTAGCQRPSPTNTMREEPK